MNSRVIFTDGRLAELRANLLLDRSRECAAAFVVVPGHHQDGVRLVVHDVLLPSEEDYLERSIVRVSLQPAFVARILKKARTVQGGVFLVHTHPGQSTPSFSKTDELAQTTLAPVLYGRAPGPHGFLIFGTEGFSGRTFAGSGSTTGTVDVLQDVGRSVKFLFGSDAALSLDEYFDRNVRAFGQQGQLLLNRLHVAVVGVGGTGSIVVEELARLGVGELTLIDDEVLEETNLNRLLGSRPVDVGRAKVSVGASAARRARPNIAVNEVRGSVLDEAIWRDLIGCDFVFCCTDSHGSRAVLNQLAYQYRLPMIDVGVRIDARDNIVSAMSTRVQMLAEPLACLNCNSLLDPTAIRRDLLGDKSTDPYIVGTFEPQPAVISLNAATSSMAVSMFLSATVGFPGNARHLIGRPIEGLVRPIATSRNSQCIVCAPENALAKADNWPMIGPST